MRLPLVESNQEAQISLTHFSIMLMKHLPALHCVL